MLQELAIINNDAEHPYCLQLKLYAERGNLGESNLILSDTYSAKAYNSTTLHNKLEDDHNRIINIIICASIFVILFSATIIVVLVITFFYSKSHTQSKWIENAKKKKPTILSLTVLSGLANLYIISLALSALVYWYHPNKEVDIFNHTKVNLLSSVNTVPLFTALFTDFIAIFFWIGFVSRAGVICYKRTHTTPNKVEKNCSSWLTFGYMCVKAKYQYCERDHTIYKCAREKIRHSRSLIKSPDDSFIILSLTIFCPIFCIIAHSPFIAIAYLNDGDHASSIFIYYMVLCYLIFGVTWLFFHWCHHFIKDKNKDDVVTTGKKQDANDDHDNSQNNDKKDNHVLCCCTYYDKREKGDPEPRDATSEEQRQCFITAVILLLFVTLLFLLGLIVVISCYFVIIPINKSISNAPNRLLSIYQSGGFLIGSFIVFNILKYFHVKNKKKDVGENVDKIHTMLQHWLCHPRQQLYGLQEKLNELEQKSKQLQQQLLKQPTDQSGDLSADDTSSVEPGGPSAVQAASTSSVEPGDPSGVQAASTSSVEPGGPSDVQAASTSSGQPTNSSGAQTEIHDLQKQLAQCRQQFDQLNEQIKKSANDPQEWVDKLGEKLKQLQQKIDSQNQECQQQHFQ